MTTNFDRYLDDKFRDPAFAARFAKASEEWDIALQIARLRQERGLSQAELAKAVGTTQQVISRLESPNYRGHSRTTLDRVAEALGARVVIRLEPVARPNASKGGRKATPAKRAARRRVARGR